jgi:hypothetical protein
VENSQVPPQKIEGSVGKAAGDAISVSANKRVLREARDAGDSIGGTA